MNGVYIQLATPTNSLPGYWMSVTDRTRTDHLGRYEFRGVFAAVYWVGVNLQMGLPATNPFETAIAATASGQRQFPLPLGGHVVLAPLTVNTP